MILLEKAELKQNLSLLEAHLEDMGHAKLPCSNLLRCHQLLLMKLAKKITELVNSGYRNLRSGTMYELDHQYSVILNLGDRYIVGTHFGVKANQFKKNRILTMTQLAMSYENPPYYLFVQPNLSEETSLYGIPPYQDRHSR